MGDILTVASRLHRDAPLQSTGSLLLGPRHDLSASRMPTCRPAGLRGSDEGLFNEVFGTDGAGASGASTGTARGLQGVAAGQGLTERVLVPEVSVVLDPRGESAVDPREIQSVEQRRDYQTNVSLLLGPSSAQQASHQPAGRNP